MPDPPGQAARSARVISGASMGAVARSTSVYLSRAIYGASAGNYLNNINSLQYTGRDSRAPRVSALTINNLTAVYNAVAAGVGIAVLPDYLVQTQSELLPILPEADMPELECFLVYPEELKNVARVRVFRDFLVSNAQRWDF